MWWDWRFVGLLLFSAVFNWNCGRKAAKPSGRNWLIFGVVVDLAILALFKYGLFLRDAATFHLSDRSSVYVWILPLGISFWTFEQIIYLVDCYRGTQRPLPFRDYLFFVTFFPRLIAGPIVRPHGLLKRGVRRSANYRSLVDHSVQVSTRYGGRVVATIGTETMKPTSWGLGARDRLARHQSDALALGQRSIIGGDISKLQMPLHNTVGLSDSRPVSSQIVDRRFRIVLCLVIGAAYAK